MIRINNPILNYCGLCSYLKPIKPKKVVRQSLFKDHSNFQNSIFNKVYYCKMAKRGQI